MSIDGLAGTLGKAADRSVFLKRTGAVALGAVVGAMGFAPKAHALVDYQCCHLCNNPSSCSGCACTWCWLCCGNCLTGERWACCECFDSSQYCGKSCPAICSYAYIYDYSCFKCQQPG
jgi:hypothetical protein